MYSQYVRRFHSLIDKPKPIQCTYMYTYNFLYLVTTCITIQSLDFIKMDNKICKGNNIELSLHVFMAL